jgi:hypothetical protein
LEQFGLQKCLFGSAKMRYFRQTFFFYERSFRSAGMFLIYMHNHAHTCLFMRIYTGACIHTHTHRNWHALVYTDMHEHADMHNTSWMIYNIYIYTHIVQ